MRLLAIARDAKIAQRLRHRLRSWGDVDVDLGETSKLDPSAAKSYVAIVLALSGPERSWREDVRRLRSAAEATPLIVVGDSEDEATLRRALRFGAQEYVPSGSEDSGRLRRAVLSAIEREAHAREGLLAERRRARALLRAIPDTVYRIHRSGRVLDIEAPYLGVEDVESAAHGEPILPLELAEKHAEELEAALGGQPLVFSFHSEAEELVHRVYEVRLVASGADEVLAVFRDVTASRRLEEQVALSQRLEAVGRLAGGLAHDFNNILTIIIGSAELASREPSLGAGTRRALEDIGRTAERAASLTHQLLAFSRKQILKLVALDLNGVVAETAEMLRRLIGEDITIETHLKSQPSTVRADPVQIEQILMNLAVNARDAMPAGGRLVFETDDVDVYETYFGQDVEISSGSYVALAVSDTGVGMDAATKEKAFEPFFTTKERGKGTGLGLSSVYGIVKQSGGYVWIYSERGLGTTIKIYLPSVEAVAAPKPSRETGAAAGGRGERILLVEDDPTVLDVARRFLEEGGYRVVPAASIETAFDMVENDTGVIDLLATDVVLPGMSGRELAEKLQSMRPGIKTLYLSGYTEDAIATHGVLEPGVAFLEKPYTRRRLLDAVRRAIDGATE